MHRLLFVLLLLMGACAVGESAPTSTEVPLETGATAISPLPTATFTPPPVERPPLTLAAPPAPQLTGLCADVSPLEYWLQVTTSVVRDFQVKINAAVSAAEVYDTAITLATLRDTAAAVPAPDCAAAAHLIMLDAFNRAIPAFQAYANYEAIDLNTTIAGINIQLDLVKTQQDQLIEQLNALFAGG
jgi:hypothetical protein